MGRMVLPLLNLKFDDEVLAMISQPEPINYTKMIPRPLFTLAA